MDKLPIRRKFKDNPYTLLIEDNNYYVLFRDNKNIFHKEKVSKEVFDLFDENERYENAYFFEYSTKIAKSIIKIENIKDSFSVEDKAINNIDIQNIKEIINKLPNIQKNRIIKYFFEDKTLQQIAQEENCTKMAIKLSIDIAIEKILKKIKK